MSYMQNCKKTGEVFHGFPVREFDGIKSVILTVSQLDELKSRVTQDDWISGIKALFHFDATSKRYFPLDDLGINSLHAWGMVYGIWILVRPPAYLNKETGTWHDKPSIDKGVEA